MSTESGLPRVESKSVQALAVDAFNELPSRVKPYAFLGQYLVGNDLITEYQLDDAIRLQRENNALVGTIALAQGFLDKQQLNFLIKRQRRLDERIGALAIEEGFMTEEQLATVLSIQGRNHIFLGESLVRLGTLSKEVLNRALADFQTHIVLQEKHVREQISHLPTAKAVLVTLDVTLRFFYRLGYALRIIGTGKHLPERFHHLYCSEQIFKRSGTGYMGVGMTAMLVESITQGSKLSERSKLSETNAMEDMSQLIFNLNYLACKQMKRQGIRVKHGFAFIDSPPSSCNNYICLEMETVTSPMVLTYDDRMPGYCPSPLDLALLHGN